jgi:hypothetical protein
LKLMSKLATRTLVCVVWQDAHGAALGDYSLSEIARDFHKPVTYTSFGLLIQQDEAGVTLASEQAGESYRNLSFVPAKMIVEIVDLGVPQRKRIAKKREIHDGRGPG